MTQRSFSIPLLGLGTWQLFGKECERAVKEAFEMGYHHIDTAELYENQKAIGKALQGIDRSKIFITSKYSLDSVREGHVLQDVEKLCDKALSELQTDYLDLYLLHWPDRTKPISESYTAMHELVRKRKVKHIGVSNFTIHHLQDLLKLGVPIAANQVEFHPYLYQKELWDFCELHNIMLISYRSLGKGALLEDSKLKEIANQYQKTVAQVILRWLIQKNIPVIPKASSRLHLRENLEILTFSLDEKDSMAIDVLHRNKRYCGESDPEFTY